jgi:DNA-binding beta-propeller fold protein YncE
LRSTQVRFDPRQIMAVPSRSRLLVVAIVAIVAIVAAGAALTFVTARSGGSETYEVWALDQGTDRIHVYDADHNQVAVVDVSPAALRAVEPTFDPEAGRTVPHMVDFDPEGRYAFVAATAGAATLVIDAVERQVVAVLATGAGSHMAAVTPDGSAVWVAAIGARQLVEIPLDLAADEPEFVIARRLDVEALLADAGHDWPSYAPVCHDYDARGRAWVTLGPGTEQGGLFVLDLDAGEVVHAYDPAVIRANCGIGFTADGGRAIANWSGTFGAEVADREGEWYVFDVDSFDVVHTASSDGIDAHGLRLTPDGTTFLQVNRGSDDGQVIDATTLEVLATFDAGDTPDILDYSPDGRLAYVTQRGPNPLSGDPHVAVGSQPGLLVLDVETREHIVVLQPQTVTAADGSVANDVHGVGVRQTRGGERVVVAAPAGAPIAAGGFSCHLLGA